MTGRVAHPSKRSDPSGDSGAAGRSRQVRGSPTDAGLASLVGNRAFSGLLQCVGVESVVPLGGPLRDDVQDRLGADPGEVRIHQGPEADRRTGQAGAAALTEGRDIYFGPGAFVPGSEGGRTVVAHEVAHVVQQTGNSRGPVLAGEAAERNADTAALGGGLGAGSAPAGTPQLITEEEAKRLRSVHVSATGRTIRSKAPSNPLVEHRTNLNPRETPQPSAAAGEAMKAGPQAQERAATVAQSLAPDQSHRTLSVGSTGNDVSVSGQTSLPQRPTPVPVEQVKEHAAAIGHKWQGPADYFGTHAEKQRSLTNPGEPQHVNNGMCQDCIDYMSKEAKYRQQAQVVEDPHCVREFHPDGRIIEHYKDGSIGQTTTAKGTRRTYSATPAGHIPNAGTPQPSGPRLGGSSAAPKTTFGSELSLPVAAPKATLNEAAGGLSRRELQALAEVGGAGGAARFEARIARITAVAGHVLQAAEVAGTVMTFVDSVAMASSALAGRGFVLQDEIAAARGLAERTGTGLAEYRAFSAEIDGLNPGEFIAPDGPSAARYARELHAPLPALTDRLAEVDERISVTSGLLKLAEQRQRAAGQVVSEPTLMGWLGVGGEQVRAFGAYVDLPHVVAGYRAGLNNLLTLRELLDKDVQTLSGWSSWLSQHALRTALGSMKEQPVPVSPDL